MRKSGGSREVGGEASPLEKYKRINYPPKYIRMSYAYDKSYSVTLVQYGKTIFASAE